jgi:hypothetical protein
MTSIGLVVETIPHRLSTGMVLAAMNRSRHSHTSHFGRLIKETYDDEDHEL